MPVRRAASVSRPANRPLPSCGLCAAGGLRWCAHCARPAPAAPSPTGRDRPPVPRSAADQPLLWMSWRQPSRTSVRSPAGGPVGWPPKAATADTSSGSSSVWLINAGAYMKSNNRLSTALLTVLLAGLTACQGAPVKKAPTGGTATTTAARATTQTAPTIRVTLPAVTSPPATARPVTAPPVTAPPLTEPPVTAPLVTAPPAIAPVVTAPPATAPLVTAPPATAPLVTAPPATAPLVTAPPATAPLVTAPPATAPLVTAPPATAPPAPPSGDGYINSNGNYVPSPTATPNSQAPPGATAQCGDGTYSFSQHRSGTCSHHGGVSAWL